MGFPSYAHPMIPDIELLLSENRFTSYPHTEYFNSLSSLSIKSLSDSKISWVIIVRSLISESKIITYKYKSRF